MFVGAICFTSSGSNGGCWVVLVFPRLLIFFFGGKKGFFFPYATYAKKKKFTRLTPKKFSVEKKTRLRPKKKVTRLTPKQIKKQLTLISTIELRFPLNQRTAFKDGLQTGVYYWPTASSQSPTVGGYQLNFVGGHEMPPVKGAPSTVSRITKPRSNRIPTVVLVSEGWRPPSFAAAASCDWLFGTAL